MRRHGDRPKAAPQGPWPLGMRNEVNADLTDIESRDNGMDGCLLLLTARSAAAENRQVFQDSGTYFLEICSADRMPVTRPDKVRP